MTKVTYHPEEFRMRIEGHAGAAPKGEDVVCAAATILGWTLIGGAEDVPEYRMHLILKDGVMDVCCYPEEDFEEQCRYLYDTIARGFDLMAGRYPDYIQMGGYHG